ncbi:MAG: hypothetical protein M0P53_07055, partial [Candidatus Cloacimonas sp.]|nr:hypothetical protein [Candidatus Cloacimonas sp.]
HPQKPSFFVNTFFSLFFTHIPSLPLQHIITQIVKYTNYFFEIAKKYTDLGKILKLIEKNTAYFSVN